MNHPHRIESARKETDNCDCSERAWRFIESKLAAERDAVDAYIRELENGLAVGINKEVILDERIEELEKALTCKTCHGSGHVTSMEPDDACGKCGMRPLLYYPDGCPSCGPIRAKLTEKELKATPGRDEGWNAGVEAAAKLCDANCPCDACADMLKSHPGEESFFCESYGCHSFKEKATEIRSLKRGAGGGGQRT